MGALLVNVLQSEAAMRKAVTRAFRAAGYWASAVDNEACDPGMPDVWYFRESARDTTGWIELKHLKTSQLPARAESPVRVPKYRPGQRIWHRDADAKGIKVHTLLLAGDLWLLHPAFWSASHLGNVPLFTLEQAAVAKWRGGFDLEQILPCL